MTLFDCFSDRQSRTTPHPVDSSFQPQLCPTPLEPNIRSTATVAKDRQLKRSAAKVTSVISSNQTALGGAHPEQRAKDLGLGQSRDPIKTESDCRPSRYCHLSRAVNGYTSSTRYTSPDARQKLIFAASTLTEKNSSKADRKVSASQTEGKGEAVDTNLVMKQIKRLYGDSESSVLSMRKKRAASLSPDLTLLQNKPHHTTSPPVGKKYSQSAEDGLESESDSVCRNGASPAVFRLLRPAFRDQLKSNDVDSIARANELSVKVDRLTMTSTAPPSSTCGLSLKTMGSRMVKENGIVENYVVTSSISKDPPHSHSETAAKDDADVHILQNSIQLTVQDEPYPIELPIQRLPELHSEQRSDRTVEIPIECIDLEVSHQPLTTIVEEEGSSTYSTVGVQHQSDTTASTSEYLDGKELLKLLEIEMFKMEEKICEFEDEIKTDNHDEEVIELLRSTIGKTRLLMGQKLAQFKSLCDKNVAATENKKSTDGTQPDEPDPFVPTPADLAGFWDMVSFQIADCHRNFDLLATVREAGWKMPPVPSPKLVSDSQAKKVTGSRMSGRDDKRGGARSNKKKTKSCSTAITRARADARKRMLESKLSQNGPVIDSNNINNEMNSNDEGDARQYSTLFIEL